MPNYSKGKIYKIWSPETDQIYIGSTTQRLSDRMADHRKSYKRFMNGVGVYMTSFELLSYEECKIELIQEFPCDNKEQLLAKEGEYIRKMPCVNKCIAGRTIKEQREEYYKTNKKEILEKQKIYYQENKEQISQRRKELYYINHQKMLAEKKKYWETNKDRLNKKRAEKVKCECGSVTTKNHLARHQRTQKHQKYLQQLEENLQ